MAYKHKENTGSIFKNEKKEKDTHPSMTGSALIDGVEYWVSAWTNDGEKGRWQSLAFQRKDSKTIKTPEADKKATAKAGGAFDDDIPFAPIGRSHAL